MSSVVRVETVAHPLNFSGPAYKMRSGGPRSHALDGMAAALLGRVA
jgi:hypothetical protein